MEKIGIVTIIDNNNYGNRLQNYAVQQILRKKGYSTETLKNDPIINYKDKLVIRLLKFMKKKCFNRNTTERYKNFIEFNRIIQFSKYYITPFSKIDKKYKFFICGSDQVWNPNFKRLSEVDLLSFVKENKRIAFSSSFGVEKIPKEKNNLVKKEIEKFKAISVRETAGKDIIEKLSGRKDIIVLVDPTMIIDVNEWNKIIKKPKQINNNRYILNYFLGEISQKRRNEINKIAEKHNCQIINILDRKSEFYQAGPSEFLYLEKNAFLICTDSFHACVFAILYNRPFIVFNREDSKKSMNSRIETLLSKFELEDRYYKGEITPELLKHDYINAYKILEKEREKANIFLNSALESGEKQ